MEELAQIDAEIEKIKQEILRAGLAYEEDLQNNKLKYFVPNPKQLQFFEQADKPHRAGFCGNRFGKSTIGVVEDICFALGERPFFPEGHPLRRKGIPNHGVKILVVAEDWDKVDEIFTNNEGKDRLGKFFEFLPKEAIAGYTRNQKSIINSITVRNEIDGIVRESIIIFDTVRSYINNPRAFESSDWDVIHLDEPVMQDLWTAASRGLLDRGGKSWWLMTPLGFPWMYEFMLANAKKDPEYYWWFEASMDDNPLLDEKAKQVYLDSLPTDEKECRQQGKPLAYGRRVYGLFDEEFHLWPFENVPPAGWTDMYTPPQTYFCGYAIDPHPQTPHAVLFTAISPEGDVYFFDEIFERSTIRELAHKVIERRQKLRVGFELCDPVAWNDNQDTKRCWADTLYEEGLYVQKASKEKTAGIIQTQQIFDKKRVGRVYVMRHMQRFLKEIRTYFFDRENKPVDKDDHIMECLYRTAVHDNLRWYPASSTSAPIINTSEPLLQTSANLGEVNLLSI
jgi:hypothetical protein